VHAAAEAALPKPGRRAPRSVTFGRESKKTLELSLRAALHLGHNYIGTEHILLGLLVNDGDAAANLLATLGVSRDQVEEWITAELAAMQSGDVTLS
jgi:ATP-dependent Clp protease ATP-binding subunit ClpA